MQSRDPDHLCCGGLLDVETFILQVHSVTTDEPGAGDEIVLKL